MKMVKIRLNIQSLFAAYSLPKSVCFESVQESTFVLMFRDFWGGCKPQSSLLKVYVLYTSENVDIFGQLL